MEIVCEQRLALPGQNLKSSTNVFHSSMNINNALISLGFARNTMRKYIKLNEEGNINLQQQ